MPSENVSIKTPRAPDTDAKHFTVSQANSTLPYVSRIVADIAEVYARVLELRSGADTGDEREYETTMDRLGTLVDELHAVGVELKDFELGLVDFPAVHEGRDILLCWKRGETDIDHWHEIDAGLAGRQPVALLESEED